MWPSSSVLAPNIATNRNYSDRVTPVVEVLNVGFTCMGGYKTKPLSTVQTIESHET